MTDESKRVDAPHPNPSPNDYVRQLSTTTGLPHVLVRKNRGKIRGVMAEMGSVLNGLISTMKIRWDQPHEGNLFEHLYARRAFQRTA